MAKKKFDKTQRRAFARVLYFGFTALGHATHTMKLHPYFDEALTDREKEEFEKLNDLTRKLSLKYRSLAWKLEGFDPLHGPPRPIGGFKELPSRRKKRRKRATQ